MAVKIENKRGDTLDVGIKVGDMVKVPTRATRWSGGGSIVFAQDNSDGSFETVVITTSFGAGLGTGTPGIATTMAYGKALGVRFRDLGTSFFEFTVIIDGECFRVNNDEISTLLVIGNAEDLEGLRVLDDDLPDTVHQVQVLQHCDPSINKNIVLFGLVADNRAGYEPPVKSNYVFAEGVLGTVSTRFEYIKNAFGVKSVNYTNTSNADVTVNINWASVLFKKLVIPANDSLRYDFPDGGMAIGTTPGGAPTTVTTGFNHNASVGGVVNYKLIGGC